MSSGSFQQLILGGTAAYAYVAAGGVQYNYGSAYGADVYGVTYTYPTGVDYSTDIASGGAQYVYGDSYFAAIAAGGTQYLEFGGYADGSEGADSGYQFVYSGGEAEYTWALSGGVQYVYGVAYYTMFQRRRPVGL